MKENGMEQQIIVYKSSDGSELPVKTDGETMWMTIEQMTKMVEVTVPIYTIPDPAPERSLPLPKIMWFCK